MQQTKLVAALVVIGAFIAGGALGVAGDRALRSDGHDGGPSDPHTFWDRTAKEWGLSQGQRNVVDSLMDAQHGKISALYKPLRPSIDSVDALARIISDSTQAQLRRTLTPDQQAKFDAMRADMKSRDAERDAQRKAQRRPRRN